MSARLNFSAILGLLITPALVLAQQALEVPQVDNSNNQFEAVTNANVFVRSGPGDAYYSTARLPKGATVTVIGHRLDWLKVLPPEGSFSYVAKQFVEKQGDTGRIHGSNVNIRAGSGLGSMKYAVQCKLNVGDEVTILGEQDEYYKIKPPAGAYLYVHQKGLDPLRRVAISTTQPSGDGSATTQPSRIAWRPTTKPANPDVPEVEQPIRPDAAKLAAQRAKEDEARQNAESEFGRLEAAYREIVGLKLTEQTSLPELLADYEKLAKNESLPASMLRIAEQHLPYLRARNKSREEFLATMEQQNKASAKADEIRRNREQLQEENNRKLQLFAAVGTLQASAVQPGGPTLYRITDPATGRTQCYIRSNDPAYSTMLGKFLGVKGKVLSEPQLPFRVVDPAEVAEVDPARVGSSIVAQITPPSLMKAQPADTANTDTKEQH